ncbi:MAG: PEP-CTERM sorting domain-containing protein [Fuerstiella sp.]
MKKESPFLIVSAIALLVGVSAEVGSAAIITYNSQAVWETANAGFATDDFNGVVGNTQLAEGVNENVGLFSVFYETTGGVNEGGNNLSNGSLRLQIDTGGTDQTQSLTFSFPSPIFGFGFNITGLNANTERWQFTVDGNNFNIADVIDSNSSSTSLSGFAGFRSDVAISSISVANLPVTVSPFDGVQFESVFVAGTSAAAVPEPSTSVLLGLGFCGLGYRRVRRKRQLQAE